MDGDRQAALRLLRSGHALRSQPRGFCAFWAVCWAMVKLPALDYDERVKMCDDPDRTPPSSTRSRPSDDPIVVGSCV